MFRSMRSWMRQYDSKARGAHDEELLELHRKKSLSNATAQLLSAPARPRWRAVLEQHGDRVGEVGRSMAITRTSSRTLSR